MRDIIPRKQQTSRRDIAKGYVRIEAEAGNQIALQKKKEKLRDITRSGKQTRALGRKLGRTVGWQ